MSKSKIRNLRQLLKGTLKMPNETAVNWYEDAVTQYAWNGNEIALTDGLTLLGVSTANIRWHVANRGRHMSCTWP